MTDLLTFIIFAAGALALVYFTAKDDSALKKAAVAIVAGLAAIGGSVWDVIQGLL